MCLPVVQSGPCVYLLFRTVRVSTCCSERSVCLPVVEALALPVQADTANTELAAGSHTYVRTAQGEVPNLLGYYLVLPHTEPADVSPDAFCTPAIVKADVSLTSRNSTPRLSSRLL